MNKKISFLQTFGIILVVLGHAGNNNHEVKNGYEYLYRWIYSFHMPLFVFISGYLLKFTNKNIADINILNFIKKKSLRLIVPYIVISSLAYLPKFVLNKFTLRPVELTLKDYIFGFLYPWNNPIIFFWFLPTIFLIMLLTIYCYRILKSNLKVILMISLLTDIFLSDILNMQLLNLNGVLNYFIFFILGVYYSENEDRIDSIILKKIITLIVIVILSVNLILNISSLKVGYLIVALSGIIFSLNLANIYKKNEYTFFKHLNGKSYSIYLLSWFPQIFIRIVGYQILKLPMIIVVPVSLLLGIYVPVFINIIGKMIFEKEKKFKFLKYILGI